MSSRRRSSSWSASLGLVVLTALLLAVPAAAEAPEPWSKNSQWLSLRIGYAKSGLEAAPDGNIGVGLGYMRFRNSRWAFGAHAHLELLGKYGNAALIEVPWTVEVTRHFNLNMSPRPYLGLGGGVFYNKTYRTSADAATLRPGGYLTGGMNQTISDHGVLGFDARVAVVGLDKHLDPVFGSETVLGERKKQALRWGVKLNYAFVF